MIASFSQHKEQVNSMLATASVEDMLHEINKRGRELIPFPLEVFNDKIKPFLGLIHKEYTIPKSFIGLGLLTAYSSAIGNSYWMQNNKLGNTPSIVWGCTVGISSSGKSILLKQLMQPHFKIQENLSAQWAEMVSGVPDSKREHIRMQKLIINNTFLPTITRRIMPENPKGLFKEADEILEWINSFNTKSGKEGTDEQFWLKCWNGGSHEQTRGIKEEIFLKKLFISVFGGTQPTVLHKLFANERGTTGFIYRLLFAIPEYDMVALPNIAFDMPAQLEDIHNKSINSLYYGLPVNDVDDDVRYCKLTPAAIKEFITWRDLKAHKLHGIEDLVERNLHAGVFGKINEYIMRFCVLLHISDKALDHKEFFIEEIVDEHIMYRALKLADYFYESAIVATEIAMKDSIAPAHVLQFKTYISNNYSYTRIAEMVYPNLTTETGRKKVAKDHKQYIQKYPRVFGAYSK